MSSNLLCSCATEGKERVAGQSLQEQRRKELPVQPRLRQEVDSIVVRKAQRALYVYSGGIERKTYVISLGTSPVGAKRMQGDHKTPEGLYFINGKNPGSLYHKNLGISYPNAADRLYARQHNLRTGGDIKIHGLPNQRRYQESDYLDNDWTWGCIAVSNEDIDELYRYVPEGTPILILP